MAIAGKRIQGLLCLPLCYRDGIESGKKSICLIVLPPKAAKIGCHNKNRRTGQDYVAILFQNTPAFAICSGFKHFL